MTIAKAYLDGLEKDSSLLGLGLGAAAGHIGTNLALGQAMQGPRFLPDILRAGYQHGMSKQQLSPFREELITKTLGPELPALYHEARKAGKLHGMVQRVEGKGEEYKQRFMNRLMSKAQGNPQLSGFLQRQKQIQSVLQNPGAFAQNLGLAKSPETREARVQFHRVLSEKPDLMNAMQRAYARENQARPMTVGGRFFRGDPIMGSTPATVPAGYQGPLVGGKVTKAHRYLSSAARVVPEAAGVAATLAGVPGVGEPTGHMLVNKARDLLGRTRSGEAAVKGWMSRAYRGQTGALGMGPGLAGMPNRAVSVLLSPGISMAQQMAGALGRVAKPVEEAAVAAASRHPAVAQPKPPRMIRRLRIR